MPITVPLFPLPNVLLYPGAILPLHVFEPRYQRMVEDLQTTGSDRIVLGLLKGDWEKEYFDRPPVHPIAGLGQILHIAELPGGLSNLLVKGEKRVNILEEVESGTPYRQVVIEDLDEIQDCGAEESLLRTQLQEGLFEFADGSLMLDASASVGYLADVLIVALPNAMKEKQELFSILRVRERAHAVLEILRATNAERRLFRASDDQDDNSPWN